MDVTRGGTPRCEKCLCDIISKSVPTTTDTKLQDDGTLYYLYGRGPFCLSCLKKGVTVSVLQQQGGTV